jgi:CRP/FNR family transcriptional regulator, cyclic AMP receptor protein
MSEMQSDLLAGLGAEDAAQLMQLATRVVLAPGQRLFRLGDEADALYLVERGLVTLTLPVQIGGREEDLPVEERGPGQMVGWSGLIPPHRFTLNAAAPLETELLAFHRSTLLDHFAWRPEIAYTVTRNVACVVGQRLQVLQAMWLREVQHLIELRSA